MILFGLRAIRRARRLLVLGGVLSADSVLRSRTGDDGGERNRGIAAPFEALNDDDESSANVKRALTHGRSSSRRVLCTALYGYSTL